jgi:hypothetical protein
MSSDFVFLERGLSGLPFREAVFPLRRENARLVTSWS